ncbi:MAG: peroxidase-related enzyme [Candidatus Binatia bacterium]
MLPLIYPGDGIAQAIMDDVQQAPIPDCHKAMFRWVERFTRCSWNMTERDVEGLRVHALSDSDIVNWAQIASLQTWWVMSSDGGGVPLEAEAVTGSAIGRLREVYQASAEGLTAGTLDAPARRELPAPAGVAWVATDGESEAYRAAVRWATSRYGFVPNLMRAVSLRPEVYPRHQLALELLEHPQSQSLSQRHHAMVRALVSSLNRCVYSAGTTRQLLERVSGDERLYSWVTDRYADRDWGLQDRVVLDFAAKLARNAYKVTEQDAQSFRDCGLDDEAYIDVLNTVAIQTSLDRLANSLGVSPDAEPLLPERGAGRDYSVSAPAFRDGEEYPVKGRDATARSQ